MSRSDPQTAMPPQRLLRMADVAFRAGETATAQSAMARLAGVLPSLKDGEMAKLLSLAIRGERPALAADIMRHAATRPVMSPQLALAILRQAQAVDSEQLAIAVESELIARVEPSQRDVFRAKATRMRQGPGAALDLVRQVRRSGRTPASAVSLAQALLAAGKNVTARRYLRLCNRKWPNSPTIAELYLDACCKSGRPDEARAWLDTMDRGGREVFADALQLRLALETGALDRALKLLEQEVADGHRRASDPRLLRTRLALGHLEDAEASAEAFRKDPTHSLKSSMHFGVHFIGQLLNELRFYRRIQNNGSRTGPGRTEAVTNFYAAKDILDRWHETVGLPRPDRLPEQDVPKNIFQYWNAETVPDEVQEVMRSWQSRAGWNYKLFSKRSAVAWLRRAMGPKFARAFSMAGKPAEESDFLRLCLLWSEGGIYADVDDRLVAKPEQLVELGPGLVVFREPFGALDNNVICAPPKHPALSRAVVLARNALLRRDKDLIWLKTGPGLLTRAVALSILDDSEDMQGDLTIVPTSQMGRIVQPHIDLPYKHGQNDWRATPGVSSREVASALLDLTANDAQGARL